MPKSPLSCTRGCVRQLVLLCIQTPDEKEKIVLPHPRHLLNPPLPDRPYRRPKCLGCNGGNKNRGRGEKCRRLRLLHQVRWGVHRIFAEMPTANTAAIAKRSTGFRAAACVVCRSKISIIPLGAPGPKLFYAASVIDPRPTLSVAHCVIGRSKISIIPLG